MADMLARADSACPSAPRGRGRRVRLLLTLAVLLTSLLAGSTAQAAPEAPVTAAVGVLAQRTEVAWSGNTGITLSVPRATQLTKQAFALHVSRGTYAYVRAFGRPAGCAGLEDDYPTPAYCADYTATLSFLEVWSDALREDGKQDPLDNAELQVSDPATLSQGTLDLYLFTDGQAELTLSSPGGAGNRRYRAAARVDGPGLVRLPLACAGPQCATPLPGAVVDSRRAERTVTSGPSTFLDASAYLVVTSRDTTRESLGLNRDQLGSLNVCVRDGGVDSECDPLAGPTAGRGKEDVTLLLNSGRQLGIWKTLFVYRAPRRANVGCVVATVLSTEDISRGCLLLTFNYGLSADRRRSDPQREPASKPPPARASSAPGLASTGVGTGIGVTGSTAIVAAAGLFRYRNRRVARV